MSATETLRAPTTTAVGISPLSPADRRAGDALDGAPAHEIVAWAVERFGDHLCVSTSFTDTVLVHLATTVAPDLHVVFLDTGFHFAETLATQRAAQARYGLNLTVARPSAGAADVWADGVAACCGQRKVDVLDTTMAELDISAWLSGVRRADGPSRAGAPVIDGSRSGRVKVNPLVNWSDADVERYVLEHDLVVNPLTEQGYPSVGCWPCTEPVAPGTDARSGRWQGSEKTECGLHL